MAAAKKKNEEATEDSREDRIEEYEVQGPDGPVQVRHNIDTGETEIIG